MVPRRVPRLGRGCKVKTLNRTVAASATGAVTGDPLANACRGGRDSTEVCNCLSGKGNPVRARVTAADKRQVAAYARDVQLLHPTKEIEAYVCSIVGRSSYALAKVKTDSI